MAQAASMVKVGLCASPCRELLTLPSLGGRSAADLYRSTAAYFPAPTGWPGHAVHADNDEEE